MLRLCLIVSLFSAASGLCVPGTIETRSGQRLTGDIRIAPEKLIVADTNGAAVEVALPDLKLFRASPTHPSTNTLTILSTPPTNGLLGIYYNSPDCTGDFFKTRFDPAIDFDWGQSPPLPDMKSNGFSVRWVGRVTAPHTEHYTFHTITDGGIRLWINNTLLIDSWKDQFQNLTANAIILMAGHTNDLRLEMYDGKDRAIARLLWSSPSTQRTLVPTTCLAPAASVEFAATPAAKVKYPAGVLMVNGSMIAGQVEAADKTSARVRPLGTLDSQPSTLSAIQVARLIFRPITVETDATLRRNRPGVLLKNGDFVEGEFIAFKAGQIHLNSVILGTKTISTAHAVAVVLHDLRAAPAKFEVKTRGDGVWRASRVELLSGAVALNDPAFPPIKLAAAEILEINQPATE